MNRTELSQRDIHKLKSIVDKLAVSEQLDSAERVLVGRYESACEPTPFLSRSTCNELGIEFMGHVAQFIAHIHRSIKTHSFDFKLDEDPE
jgi:hypothetical protein